MSKLERKARTELTGTIEHLGEACETGISDWGDRDIACYDRSWDGRDSSFANDRVGACAPEVDASSRRAPTEVVRGARDAEEKEA